MVLRLKTRKSRSPPGLRKTELHSLINYKKPAEAEMLRRVLCFRIDRLISTAMPNLPHCENAIIDLAKLRDYCLNTDHPRGRHKARVFREALGLSIDNAEWLRQNLLEGIQIHPAEQQDTDGFGSRWRVDLPLTRQGKSVVVRTGWIIKTGEQFPRLITCWVLQ
jgi:hypothetical protein